MKNSKEYQQGVRDALDFASRWLDEDTIAYGYEMLGVSPDD